MSRQATLQTLKDNPDISVLIIGGGVNGIGVFRDLALQGVDALLVDRGDFCSGASAGSSHMLHGGIRYLENGEFRLVNEALRERDRMLRNAPHYARPLRTTIPIFRWFSGARNAPLKFFNLLDRPGERGALVIKIGLTLYDWFARGQAAMPKHEFQLRAAALRQYPQLNPEIVCAASYYDAWMPYPERICLEMLLDAEASNPDCRAINYMSAVAGDPHSVTLRDELLRESFTIKPKVVVNAAGPWIDFVNRRMGRDERRFISGTKGAHLVLDHPDLLAATGGSEIFFENDDGRIVLILPYLGRVLIGTTDIRIDNPDDALVSDEEIDYMLGMVDRVFPSIQVRRSHIVFRFSAVRPLPYSQSGATGQISRDHSIETIPADGASRYPIYSLVGGKWTTFRAFSEQAADCVLSELGLPRRTSTQDIAIGGGRAYPRGGRARRNWLQALRARCELPMNRLCDLFERYGARADEIAMYISVSNDRALANHPGYSRREIEFILRNEKVMRLEDLVLRRTVIAMLGDLTSPLLDELAGICAETLAWSNQKKEREVQRARELLHSKHQIQL